MARFGLFEAHSSSTISVLKQSAETELHILAVFDPLRVAACLPLAVEAIYIDFLQSFDRN
jgi:hypothetical protein